MQKENQPALPMMVASLILYQLVLFEEPYYYACRPDLVDKASREIPREITSFNLIGCG
jgi:hypothetical protein